MPLWWRHVACAPKATSSNPQWPAGTRPETDALFRAVRSEIASLAVIVDTKDDNARRFYERESFLPFTDQPLKLFRPMNDIAALFR
ncbi:hypothetical protein FHS26_001338 [Rhizobium pisi]|uniref:GNAT family N-acetyltransferase n=1 Tax=Rhizobium pisi TaxID=574561 RepID=A0A3R9AZS1_9HYPH|nr:hypothetical protein [Rhizobium pisi]MBB3133625.1 hypothetical protein [Rhizobium pisi]RSB81634.1 hypothetical protein EFD55_06645 [Rhizobium pisi]TBE31652.1 hypothetical protein ELH07_02555 [Rhizobium ruizarguesonis]